MGQHDRHTRPLQRSKHSLSYLVRAVLACAIGQAVTTGLMTTLPLTAMAADATTAALSGRKSYDIPAGPLETALNRFGREAGILLSFPTELTAGQRSSGLSGSYTVQEALSRLLDGTGLAAAMQPDGGYVLAEKAQPAASISAADQAVRTMPKVTVLGTRAPGVAMSNVPSSISHVDEERVQRDLATSARIEDILARNVPGVHPSNVGVRTIRGRTAQIFVNGAPMNEQMRFGSGSDLNTLSPDHLAAVEVSRGANSAYGFGSPGGIIALTTPRAQSDSLSLNTRLRSSFNTSHAEDSFQSTVYQSASQIVGAFDFHVGASFTRDGSNYTPDGDVANIFTSPGLFKTGTENIYNLDGSFGYDLGDAGQLRLTVTGQYVDYLKYYNIDGGVYRGTYATATRVPTGDRSYRRASTFNLTYENEAVLGSALKLELFRSDVYASRHELGDAWYKQENGYLGLRSAITTPLDVIREDMSVTYGLDAIRNDMEENRYSSATGVLTGIFGPPAQLDMLAPYAQLDVPFGKAKLSSGVRHERYGGHVDSTGNGTVPASDDGPGGDIRDFDLTLFNAGLLYSLTDRVDLHATYSQGAEISQIRRSGFVVDSPDRIDPQAARSHQYELGLRYETGDVSAGVSGFYTRSRLMSSTDCSNPTIPCVPLREPRRFWGVELSGDWSINEQWNLSGTFTWHDGRREARGSDEWTPVSSVDVAPTHGSIALDYAPRKGWRNSLIMDWRGARGRIGDAWPYGQVDAVTLVHLASAVAIGPGMLELGVHNLFDETYFSIQAEAYNGGWVWLPEQGRRASLSYAVTW